MSSEGSRVEAEQKRRCGLWRPESALDRDAPRVVGSTEACKVGRSRIQIQAFGSPEHNLQAVQAVLSYPDTDPSSVLDPNLR